MNAEQMQNKMLVNFDMVNLFNEITDGRSKQSCRRLRRSI